MPEYDTCTVSLPVRATSFDSGVVGRRCSGMSMCVAARPSQNGPPGPPHACTVDAKKKGAFCEDCGSKGCDCCWEFCLRSTRGSVLDSSAYAGRRGTGSRPGDKRIALLPLLWFLAQRCRDFTVVGNMLGYPRFQAFSDIEPR